MAKVTGFKELERTLVEAQRALEEVDGELGTVRFDPDDPASIEAAIVSVESMVEERLGGYSSNPIIGPVIDEMKEKYRQQIIDKAAEARLQGEVENGE